MTDCPNGEQRDLALQYLAGRLPEDEAKAFEAHYFACESCAQDVEEGSELRAALGRPAVALAAREVRSSRTWLPFAAAAAIALVAVGLWQAARQVPEAAPPVLRSGVAEGALDVKVETDAHGRLNASWTPRPEAASYVVQVFAPDGSSVWKSESREPRLAIDVAALPSRKGAALAMQVEAIDAMGRVVASSELFPLPDR